MNYILINNDEEPLLSHEQMFKNLMAAMRYCHCNHSQMPHIGESVGE